MLNKRFVIVIIGFIFSCCLIEVKAEEISSNLVVDDYKVYVDDNEITNYDLIDDKDIKITQVYSGDNEEFLFDNEEEFIIDYTNNLYGKYYYRFNLFYYEEIVDSRLVTINYLGDNNSLINTKGLYYKNKNYYILDDIVDGLTVLDVILMFNDELDDYNATLSIVNDDGVELSNADKVENGYKLKLSALYNEYGNVNEIVDYFDINIVGDVNKDNLINNLDIKCIIVDSIFNKDSFFEFKDINSVDLGDLGFSSDLLDSNLEHDEEVFVDDVLEVKYYINGFNNDVLNGIMGKMNYDKDFLELVSINIDSVYGNYDNEGNFIYLLDKYNKNGLFISFKFKTLKLGKTNVFLSEIKGITSFDDYSLLNENLYSMDINIIDHGKGGDVLEDSIDKIDKDTIDNKDDEEVKVDNLVNNKIEIYEELLPAKEIQHILLSSDNSIKKLKIKGYNIDFKEDVLEYFIEVGSNVSKLDFDIKLSDKDAFYEIVGNEKFKSGTNQVFIVVTALDGSSKTYTINVEKENDNEEISEEEKTTSKNITIMLIIFVIIGLLYIIFKDDEEVV